MRLYFTLLLFLFGAFTTFAQVQTGKASFYANSFKGHKTASGEKFNPKEFTAAHRQLPFGTKVRVTNLANNKSVIVRINDRGPFVGNRIIDVSSAAAKVLGFLKKGVTDVTIKVVDSDTKITGKPISKTSSPENKPDKAIAQQLPDSTTAKDSTTTAITKAAVLTPAKKLADSITRTPIKSTAMPPDSTQSIVGTTTFYTIAIAKSHPSGFGIQIGSFSDGKNAITLAEELNKTQKKPITLEVKTVENTPIYSLILGDFKTREAATAFKESIHEAHPDSFVVNFSESAQ